MVLRSLRDEHGGMIFFLLLGVALFAALAYVFLQGSRGNITMVTNEAAKAASYRGQDCSNAVNLAVKRLQTRGCGSLVSYEADGSNPNANAPSDGSCSIYHTNGGGVAPCNVTLVASAACTTNVIGDICPDGTIYAGHSPDGNVRMYITDASHETFMGNWGPDMNNGVPYCTMGGEPSCTTGQTNTATTAANPANNVPAYCANLTAHGHSDWYLPSRNELSVISIVHQGGFGSLQDWGWYYSSSEWTNNHAWLVRMTDGGFFPNGHKPNTDYVRCARKD